MDNQKIETQEQEQLSRRSDRHENAKQAKKKSPKSKVMKTLLILLLVSLTGALSYGALMIADAQNLLSNAYRPRGETTTVNGKEVDISNIDPLKDPISILVMGIDDNKERNLGSARTDSMIVVTFNPKSHTINTTSIPRDTYTKITTKKFKGKDKINTAYTYGGDMAAIQAVQDLLDIPIHYYLTIDFDAFKEIIDALGGIEVDVPMNIYSEYASEDNPNAGDLIVPKGKQVLDGEKALVFARVRKTDNDIERGKRQQLILKKVIQKAANIGSVTKYTDVLKSLKGHFWTDMKTKTMFSIAKAGLQSPFKIHSYAFDWTSFQADGADYVSLNKDSLSYISHKLNVSLGLEEKDKRDKKGYKFKTNGIPSPKTSISGYSDSESYGTSDSSYDSSYNSDASSDGQEYQSSESQSYGVGENQDISVEQDSSTVNNW